MEDMIGFDVKHAMHLVRLINMCKQILTENTLSVYRPDRDILMDIRNGKWSFDQIEQFVLDSEVELETLYPRSTLRNAPDRKGIQLLYYEICEDFYKLKL